MMQQEIATALGNARPLTLGGKTYQIEPLDFNDLGEIEIRFGSFEALKVETIDEMRFFMWLLLRKADLGLTAEDRELCNYTLTEMQAGKMLTFNMIKDGSVKTFIMEALRQSGFIGDEAQKPPKKQRGGAGATAELSPSSSSAAESATAK